MKATIKNLLIAQHYSNEGKGLGIIGESDLHYKQIRKIQSKHEDSSIRSRYVNAKEELYSEKCVFLNKAMKSAKKEKIRVVYDLNEGCIYFEMPFGQCSFHLFEDSCLTDSVEVIEDYQWNGLKNTHDLLQKAFNNL